MLGKVFEKFIDKAPVAVMVRGVLERVLNPDALNDIYARAAVRQYPRDLLFSSVVGLMHLVVCRIQPTIHAAYQDNARRNRDIAHLGLQQAQWNRYRDLAGAGQGDCGADGRIGVRTEG